MRAIVDQFKIAPYKFVSEFDSGGSIGGDITLWVQEQGKEGEILGRTFYFDTASDQHMRNFARKFARNAEYRQTCIDRTVRWARVAEWYERNAYVYWSLWTRQMDHRVIEKRCYQLYKLLDKQLEELEALPGYQEHLKIEAESPAPSMQELDPDIAEAVRLFNAIPGVVTKFSCQGIRRSAPLKGWEFGPIWFPGKHMPFAHIAFEAITPDLGADLHEYVASRKLGVLNMGRFPKVESIAPEKNEAFVGALEEFARAALAAQADSKL